MIITSLIPDTHFKTSTITLLVIIGTILSWWAVSSADQEMRVYLLRQTRIIAQTIDVNQIKELAGNEQDLNKPAYNTIKRKFSAMKQASEKCRFIYLIGLNQAKQIFFLVDNEDHDSEDCSPPGQIYTEAPECLQKVFQTQAEALDGPVTDRWGTHVSAFVPVRDPTTKDLIAVLGLDVSISTWRQELAAKAALPIGLTLLLIIGILVMIFSRSDTTEAPKPVLNRLMPAMSLLLVFLITGAGTIMHLLYHTSLQENLGAINAKTYEELHLSLHYQALGLAAAMNSITAHPGVIKAVSEKNSSDLLACWEPVYKALASEQTFSGFGFFDENQVCIAKPQEIATNNLKANVSLANEAKLTGKAASGLELTSDGRLVLKIVSPIFANGSLVGYFELGREIEDILEDLHSRSKMQIAVSAKKNQIDRQAWEARQKTRRSDNRWGRFPDSLIIFESQKLLPDEFTQTLETPEKPTDFVTSNTLFEGKTWRASGMPLKDASGQEISTLFLINDITTITGTFNRMIVIGGVLTAVLLAGLLGFVFVLLRRTDAGILAGQAELCKKEERQAATLRSIGEGVIACDREGRIESINLAAEKLTAWSAAEAIGKPIETVLNLCSATGAPVRNFIPLALEEGRVIELSEGLFLKTRNGQQLQIAHSCAPIRNTAMEATGAVLVFRDITEICRRNEELAEERIRIEYILGITKTGIDIIDPQFNLRYVDPAWQLTYGKSEGRKCYEYFMGLSEPCPGCGIPEALRSRKIIITEEILPRENNRLVEVHTIPFQDSENKWLVAEFNVDITERRRLEEEGKKLQSQLAQAQKMESVGLLAGGVAHDFNNMLSVILGQAELALEELSETSKFREHLEEIQKAARRSADLTSQLLAFARKQTIAPKVLNLNVTIDSMLKMLTRLIGENIELIWKPAEKPVTICIDPSQVDQLLANLLVNARDAIGAQGGTATIETSCVSLEENCGILNPDFSPGEYVVLNVTDNGCGMTNETTSHLFEPFFTTKATGCGTGLGLATVYGIVKQNNGFIEVQSEPGKGTSFKIHLPRHTTEAAAITRHASTPAATKNETILLVEDEPAILKISTMMLERMGYRVLVAETPEKAMQIASEQAGKIQLLMTDVIMPSMNGRELAQKILACNPGLACLFMSGYTADVIADHGVLNEGVHFIQKPFSMNDLAEKLRKTLDSAG